MILKSHRTVRRHAHLAVEALEDRTVPATVTWDGGGGNFNWTTAANWSGDVLPGPDDDVVIDFGANNFTVALPSGTQTVQSVTAQAGLNVIGMLVIAADSLFAGPFTLSGGTLAGAGNATVTGSAILNGSLWGPAGCSIEFQGPVQFGGLRVHERDITFVADLTWEGINSFDISGTVTVTNQATWHLRPLYGYSQVFYQRNASEPVPVLINNGTIIRETGPNSTYLAASITNNGLIDVQSGNVYLGDNGRPSVGVNTGAITGAAGTVLRPYSNWTFPGSITTAGTIEFTQSTYTMAGTYSAAQTTISNSTVTFSGPLLTLNNLTLKGGGTLVTGQSLTTAGLFTWSGGTLQGVGGSGSLTAAGGTVLTGGALAGGFDYLNPTGAVANWYGNISVGNGSVFENAGTMNAQTNASMLGTSASQIRNTGRLIKLNGSPGTGLFDGNVIGPNFTNSGTLELAAGTLALGYGGNANSGTITAAAGTTLWLTEEFNNTGSIDADKVIFHGGPDPLKLFSISGGYKANGTQLQTRNATVVMSGEVAGLGDVNVRGTLNLTGATFVGAGTTWTSLSLATDGQSGVPPFFGTVITSADVTVTGLFTWNNGALQGVGGLGSLTVLSNMTLNGTHTVRDFNLINAGDAVWTGGTVNFYSASRFTNLTGATFDDRIDGNFGGIDTCPVFDNRGLFRKTGGDGTTFLHMQLANSGNVVIERGVLNIHCGYVQVVGDGGAAGTISGTFTGTSSIQNVGDLTAAPTPTPPPPITNYTQTATGSLTVAIGGPTPGTGYGQIAVTGNVSLAGTLAVVLTNGFSPQLSNTFTIIDNRGTNPVIGTFAGLPEGGTVQLGSIVFQISYQGGTGNDVVLTVVSFNSPPTVNAGGPYTVSEGGSVTLDASGSSDPDQAANTLTYEWDFDGDDEFDDATGMNPIFSAVGLDGYPGAVVTVRLRVTDSAGTSNISTATISVANVAPTPAIDSISSVRVEGTAIAVTGSATDPAGVNDTLTFAWSVYKDGSPSVYASGGNSTSFNFTPNDNGSYRIVLTVSDEDGGSASTEQTISVANVAPTASISGPASGQQGFALTFTATGVTDPSPIDTTAGFSFSWQVMRGSTPVNLTGIPTTGSTLSFVPTMPGTYTVLLTVTGKDGGATTISHAVTVTANPGITLTNGMLIIVGTSGDDDILVNPRGGAPEIKVIFNGTQTTYVGVTSIVIYANAGEDRVQIAGGITVPVIALGGDGDDRLKAGGGPSILVGGDGNDTLLGGSGRDILIGGNGADLIGGNGDDDILIAGSTAFDANLIALEMIRAEWISSRSFADRVANLSGTAATGVNGPVLLLADGPTRTVFDDDAVDQLTGHAGNDWFVFNITGGPFVDVATDMSAFEDLFDIDI